jgi:hypothetical protein
MRLKKLTIAVVYILIGIIIGSFGTMSWVGIKMAKTLLFLKEVELGKSGSMAWEGYNSGNSSIAIWALQQHLKNLDEYSELDWPYKSVMEMDSFITHARLAKLYKELGQVKDKDIQLSKALAISKTSTKTALNSLTNEQLIFDWVDEFDKYLYPR